jgi:ribosomal protein S12 methylthiotransferase accessory factor YcaO
LKTDKLRRVRVPAARRESLLDEFERSGLSGQEFATLAGIKYQTFATWVQRRRGRGVSSSSATKPADSMRWLETVVEAAQNPCGKKLSVMVVQLPGGARVEVEDEKQAALVKALARSC